MLGEGYSIVAARGRLTVVISPVAERGLQGVQASVVVAWGSLVAVRRLSCPKARGIAPDHGFN